YFTWAIDEARAVLSDDEFSVLAEHYHLQGRGEMHNDPARHVLYVDRDPDVVAAVLHRDVADVRRLLSSGREKLIAARGKRQMPYVDHACYANWNGLAITAFLDASVILGESRYRNLALRALDRFIEEGYRPESGFAHRLGTDPSSGVRTLDDQVQMADALLHAFQLPGDGRYLRRARARPPHPRRTRLPRTEARARRRQPRGGPAGQGLGRGTPGPGLDVHAGGGYRPGPPPPPRRGRAPGQAPPGPRRPASPPHLP